MEYYQTVGRMSSYFVHYLLTALKAIKLNPYRLFSVAYNPELDDFGRP